VGDYTKWLTARRPEETEFYAIVATTPNTPEQIRAIRASAVPASRRAILAAVR
jgi:hypothetical protein